MAKRSIDHAEISRLSQNTCEGSYAQDKELFAIDLRTRGETLDQRKICVKRHPCFRHCQQSLTLRLRNRVLLYFIARVSSCFSVGSFTFQANPTISNPRMTTQLRSNCHHFSPCRAEVGNAWWLLCQPSPWLKIPKKTLFLESSDDL